MGVPPETAVTKPLELPIVASPGLLLVHVPVPGVELNVAVAPTQYIVVPVIAVGGVFTVTVVV